MSILILILVAFSILFYVLKKQKKLIKKYESGDKKQYEIVNKELQYKIQLLDGVKQNKENELELIKDRLEDVVNHEKQVIMAHVDNMRTVEHEKLLREMAKNREDKIRSIQVEQKELIDSLTNEKVGLQEEITKLTCELDNYREQRKAINESLMRDKKLEMEKDFHRILLDKIAKEDIGYLLSIENKLGNKQVLRKLIYETYLRPSIIDMQKRVLGNTEFSGIYRITDKNGMCYIGQGVNIKARWQAHCKASIGIESVAHQKIHEELRKQGWDSFTWEVLEQCPRADLHAREKFYIDFYDSKNLGYNKRLG